MYFRLAVLITLICLAFGDVIQKSDEGDVNVSQSVSAQDKEGCGSPTMPCKTLPYASRQCQTQSCSFVIDGGAEKGSYAYILNGNDSFSVACMGIRVQAKAGGSTPVIVCNQTGRYDSCFNVNGRRISVDGFEFVSTSADGQLREETSSPSKDFVSSDAKPMLVFSGGQPGSSITNCQFHDVTINIETVTIISNWFLTGSQVKWQLLAPTTLQGCDFRGCNFQIEGGPPLNMNGTMMIQTTFDVTGE